MPPLPIKGWMIDAARLPEPLSNYRRWIDFCADWGFNTILFRLVDDQGSALHFKSHPELITHAHAYTAEDLVELVTFAARRGIEMIPEVESFGHTGYITRSPQLTGLLDVDPDSGSPFTGVIPNHPGTMSLMTDLYREVADIFPSRYLHAGCDEVNWGGSAFSRAAVAERGQAAVWTKYVNQLNTLARGLGKDLMIWADHVLGHAAKNDLILEGLSRDIILVDWNYWDSDPPQTDGPSYRLGPVESTARRVLEHGFRAIGAPAWGWCRWGVRAGESQLRNIAAFADSYRALEHPNCLGVIVTNWVPSRFIPGAIWDGAAFSGTALNEGSTSARQTAFERFVNRHYGADWNISWADLFRTIYTITPPRRGCSSAWMAPFQPPVWANEADLQVVLAGERLVDEYLPFPRLLAQLAECAASVRYNASDFQAFALAVEYLGHIHWRYSAVRSAERALPADAADILRTIALRDQQILDALNRAWEGAPGESTACARFPDDPARTALLSDLSPEDQTLFAFSKAAQFSALLAAEPERFWSIIGG